MFIRTVKIKLFKPGNKGFVTLLTKAGPGRHFTAEGIEGIVKQFVDKLEAAMPDRYRMVEIGAGEFNFVRTDTEAVPAAESPSGVTLLAAEAWTAAPAAAEPAA